MLIDCDYLNKGCIGGNMDKSFSFLQINGGIMTQVDYPFEQKTATCRSDRSKYVDMKVTSHKRLDSTDENKIKEFLYQTGPLAIALNGDPLHNYHGGIIDKTSDECSPNKMNHAVTLVGYGHDNASNKDYWIVKIFMVLIGEKKDISELKEEVVLAVLISIFQLLIFLKYKHSYLLFNNFRNSYYFC